MDVKLRNIRKDFDRYPALDDVSLDIRSGELIALLGPSGSGKTTLLRLIAGLDFPTEGTILFGDEDASCRTVQERHIGFVFQHYGLFRHMTVLNNVSFGLNVRPRKQRPDKAEIRRRARELIDFVQLSGLENRYPHQLSGGQRQRVALARALAIEPTLLLLDEPFGALDAQVRRELRRWLREIHERTRHTTVFVTHDQEEALELADRVVVMGKGQIEQVGSPDEIYDRPASEFVFRFVGDSSVLNVDVRDGELWFEDSATGLATCEVPDGPAHLCFRPHDTDLIDSGAGISGVAAEIRRIGGTWRATLHAGAGNASVEIDLPDAVRPKRGAQLTFQPRAFQLYPSA